MLLSLVVFVCAVAIFVTSLAIHPLKLDNGTYYFVEEFVPKKESGVIYINVERPGWLNPYMYRVECAQIMEGCPGVWPEKFEVINNGEKDVVVPLKK